MFDDSSSESVVARGGDAAVKGVFYELGTDMGICSNLGVFSMENYIKAYLQLGKSDLHIRFDDTFQYNLSSIFMRMDGKIILNRLLNS